MKRYTLFQMTIMFVLMLSSCTESGNDEESSVASASTSTSTDVSVICDRHDYNLEPLSHYVEDDEYDYEYYDEDYGIGYSRPSSINMSRNYRFNSSGGVISGYDDEGNYYHFSYDGNGNMSGYDMNGNFYHSHTDHMGNTTGYDSNGNFYHSHTDRMGNTSGYDSNGNFYHSYTDGFGNTTIYDSNGNTHQITSY